MLPAGSLGIVEAYRKLLSTGTISNVSGPAIFVGLSKTVVNPLEVFLYAFDLFLAYRKLLSTAKSLITEAFVIGKVKERKEEL